MESAKAGVRRAHGGARRTRPSARRAGPESKRRRKGSSAVPARGRAREPEHVSSATAVAAEALRTGIIPHAIARRADDRAIPGESEVMRVGDPDDETMSNEYVGEDTPGGSTPTPDQANVDEIGRVYGVQDEDSGVLRTSRELMGERDRRRRGGDVKRGR
jgi:hypothetical protein